MVRTREELVVVDDSKKKEERKSWVVRTRGRVVPVYIA